MGDRFTSSRWIFILGLSTILALLALAFLFWKERVIYTDMAFHTFVLSVTDALAIQNHRFGAALTQMFPLLAMRLKLPLAQVLQLYSTSFYVLYLAYFFLLMFVLKQETMALVLVLYLTLLTSVSFFWAQSEFPQGMAMMILFLGMILQFTKTEKIAWWQILLLMGVGITVMFFHPLILFPLGFALMYFWLNKAWTWKFVAIAGVLMVGVLGAKGFFFPTGAYEAAKMEVMKSNFKNLFPHYINLASNKFFVKQLVGDYAGFALLTAVASGFYIYKRDFLKLAWLLGALLSYLLLINISYPDSGYGTYLQNMHLPLGFIVALPIAFEVLPAISSKYWVPAFAVLLVFRLAMIYDSHAYFTKRISYLETLLADVNKYDTNKFYMAETEMPKGIVDDTWAISYETLLLSSLSSPQNTKTIEMKDVVDAESFLLDSDFVFINRWWGWEGTALPPAYFNLKHSKYQQLRMK